jgi:D-glycero-D-manno-heptose 1,7-bisphosphate phosphatase
MGVGDRKAVGAAGRPAVFLDRDGTLNVQVVREGRPFAPDTFEEFRLIEGAREGCRALKQAGFALVVVTNQPEVGRGTLGQAVVERMHAHLMELIPEIERVEACYDPGKGEVSRRRKPEPGMVLDAAQALGIDLSRSWLIGDRWRDVDCGKRAGVRTVFIDYGYADEVKTAPDYTVPSFSEAVSVVLGVTGGRRSA